MQECTHPPLLKHITIFNLEDTEDYFESQQEEVKKNIGKAIDFMLAKQLNVSISKDVLLTLKRALPERYEELLNVLKRENIEATAQTYVDIAGSNFSGREYEEQVQQYKALLREEGVETNTFKSSETDFTRNCHETAKKEGYTKFIVYPHSTYLQKTLPGKYTYNETEIFLVNTFLSAKLNDYLSQRIAKEEFINTLETGSEQTITLHSDLLQIINENKLTRLQELLETDYMKKHLKLFKENDEEASPLELKESGEAENTNAASWNSNPLQKTALKESYYLENFVKATKNEGLIKTWKEMLRTDHIHNLCPSWLNKDNHPHGSPYQYYINFMNGLSGITKAVAKELSLTVEIPVLCKPSQILSE